MNSTDEKKNVFNLENILLYTGTIGAIIVAMVYIVFTVVLVMGFETKMDSQKQLLFSSIGAAAGLSLTVSLRLQGVQLARQKQDNQLVMKEYHNLINKTKTAKQLKTINYYLVVHFISDVFTKLITMALSTYLVLYIFLEGNGDWALIGLAIANILMFTFFGLMALSKAYTHYNEQHIPVIKERIKRLKEGENNV